MEIIKSNDFLNVNLWRGDVSYAWRNKNCLWIESYHEILNNFQFKLDKCLEYFCIYNAMRLI